MIRGARLAALLLAACLTIAGCGERPEPQPPGAGDDAAARGSVEDAGKEAEHQARQADAQFKGSPFGSVVADLAIGRPPLRARQYIVDEGDHRLTARVSSADFLCRPPEARRAAVAAFYRDANRRFRRKGVDDLELRVAVLSKDVDDIRTLARAGRRGTVLTPRGRAARDC